MRFFPRLLLSHLLVIGLALGGLFLSAEWIAPAFYRSHVEQMVRLLGPEGASLRPDLEMGMRMTLTRALLASLPLAVLVAAGTALLSSRRVVRGVQLLREGSRDLASGEYARRLPEEGRDELADLARNFNRMAAALERVEQGRVELIGNVAHELRAPLAALRGYADAMTDGVMSPEHAARSLVREVGAMERLVRDLSLVSRVEAGAVELHPSVFAPSALLLATQERFEDAFAAKGVTLEVRHASNLPEVRADLERASQVLTNLLSNALRHTPEGGRVEVEAERASVCVRFRVTDTGTGIAPEHLGRIFERFYRGDPARSRLDGGSGVGLTIARGLTEGMGGRLEVASRPGEGSTFTFTLPLASVPPPSMPRREASAQL
ncbi:two-component sensor histidine kinase [Deinococcus aetherius]|uniref:histidine kinase n=1 Tax=Deinococcus aetherius TaxID=200252 RepID=A0ABN6RFJ6_9DEIO|nr:HAMP domain-containing sensor histidine kinase [Deinococcus aetherius]BDP41016.1 two-component sensor histidine kinase [Deinococcus aetherius]